MCTPHPTGTTQPFRYQRHDPIVAFRGKRCPPASRCLQPAPPNDTSHPVSPRITLLAITLLALAGGANAGTGIFNWEIPQSCSAVWEQDGMMVTNARGTICPTSGSGMNSLSSGSTFANDVQGLKFMMAGGKTFTPV